MNIAKLETEQNEAIIKPFYVVSLAKFWFLMFATCGLYSLVWMAKQFEHQRDARGENIDPFIRAIFGIFYFLPLAKRIKEQTENEYVKREWASEEIAWALIIICFFPVFRVKLLRIETELTGFIFDMAHLAFIGGLLGNIQKQINLCWANSEKNENSNLTLQNAIWIALYWSFLGFGYYMSLLYPDKVHFTLW